MGLFDIYASTCSPSNLRGKYKPIIVVDLQSNVFNILKKYMEEHDFEDITANEEFYDLYGVQYGFEYSFIVARAEGRSIIEINVYGENKRGKVKKRLKKIYQIVEELFKDKR